MARTFGTGPYGVDRYSRGTFRGIVSIRAAARVAVRARIKALGWDTLPVPPCDIWDDLPVLPCEGAWDATADAGGSWLTMAPAGGAWDALGGDGAVWTGVPPVSGAWSAIAGDGGSWMPVAAAPGDAWAPIGADAGRWTPVPATPPTGLWVTL